MTSGDSFVLVALNSNVAALHRGDGRILWQTKLPGIMGDSFVTLTCDGASVYAAAKGRVHCLSLTNGDILWTNELKGFGYGVASLCVPGQPAAPDTAAFAKYRANQQSSVASGAAGA